MLKKIYLSFLLLTLSAVLSACMPRGETITLDQSLDLAKNRFSTAMLKSQSALPAEIQTKIVDLQKSVEKFSTVDSDSSFRAESKQIADSLKALTLKAGYTSRVSFDEVSKQFVAASDENSGSEFKPAVAKLLAQRTFHLLAAELETTKFSL